MQAMDECDTDAFCTRLKNDSEKDTVLLTAVKPTQRKLPVICDWNEKTISRIQFRFDHNEFSTVCVVCDGMGGLSGGERASALAAQGSDTASARKMHRRRIFLQRWAVRH